MIRNHKGMDANVHRSTLECTGGPIVIKEIKVNTLKEEGIAKNTLVVFTSDNGPWHVYKHTEALPGCCAVQRAALLKAECEYLQYFGGPAEKLNIAEEHPEIIIDIKNELEKHLATLKPVIKHFSFQLPWIEGTRTWSFQPMVALQKLNNLIFTN